MKAFSNKTGCASTFDGNDLIVSRGTVEIFGRADSFFSEIFSQAKKANTIKRYLIFFIEELNMSNVVEIIFLKFEAVPDLPGRPWKLAKGNMQL